MVNPMSKLLINEEPLQVLPGLATAIGLNEAIILQQMHYWININKKTNKGYENGEYWTFQTYKEWQEQFPFWSERTIRRTIKNLEDNQLLIINNFNKRRYDNTKWYRVNYKKLNEIEKACGQIVKTTGQNDHMHKDKMDAPIQETKKKIEKETKHLRLLNEYVCEIDESVKEYLEAYLSIHRYFMHIDHVRVSEKNLDKMITNLEDIKESYDIEEFKEKVVDYFQTLPENNNGSIISFLTASKRVFNVISQFTKYKKKEKVS